VTLADDDPVAGMGSGVIVDARTVPVTGSSSRKVSVSPVMNPLTDPVSEVGVELKTEGASESACGMTVAEALGGPSVPVQAPWTGVTAYVHVPAGTACSVQVSAAIVPEHPTPTG
jgi:hypothetical protein